MQFLKARGGTQRNMLYVKHNTIMTFYIFCMEKISTSLEVGQYLKAGDLIGNVLEVLKNNKGLPTSMLRFEVYKSLPERPLFWYHNQENLLY